MRAHNGHVDTRNLLSINIGDFLEDTTWRRRRPMDNPRSRAYRNSETLGSLQKVFIAGHRIFLSPYVFARIRVAIGSILLIS